MPKNPSLEQADKKDQTYWKILDNAIHLELKKGSGKWSLSELSRQSGISRPLIYNYLVKIKIR